jgi:hypothetical protein
MARFSEQLAQKRELAKDWRAWAGVGGPINDKLTCPRCGQAGGVRQRDVRVKAAVSGGRATAARLIGGLSLALPGMGRSRKRQTAARACDKCGSKWLVA